ncbi:hypothetical protein HPB48_007793 [Haemaphysalis longicornis]|uniref:ABC transporter domain-containing protein n=1 Tax=Haemaphysalis longicornis TaxID=44386 RepID=A0A9J6G794_HAELO|nr:hypothetical protein HPB48_007793 [Haemaphysalis longicornis]
MSSDSPRKQVAPFMVVHRLFKAYGYMGDNLALKGLSFTVRKGECFGLLGVNGAGKTTTFRILTGELLPHSGDACITNVSLLQSTSKVKALSLCPKNV